MGIALITNNIVSDSNIAIAALSPSYAAGGVTSTGVSTLVFSNANGVSFGMNGSTITASAAGGGGGAVSPQSYYENMPLFGATATALLGTGVSMYLQPFNLPYDVSASYIRMPVAMSFASTSANTTNSTLSYAYSQTQTMFFNIYTMGTGANSASLQLYASASNSMAMAFSVSYAASNAQTISHSFSYPIAGGTSSGSASTASQSAIIYMGTAALGSWTGSKQFDIPFASSLSEGAYWVGIQRSTASSASTQVSGTVSNATYQITNIGISQANANYNLMGTTASTNPLQMGLGVYSASATGATTGSIAMSQLSTVASQPRFPFQLIRQA